MGGGGGPKGTAKEESSEDHDGGGGRWRENWSRIRGMAKDHTRHQAYWARVSERLQVEVCMTDKS